MNKTMTMIGYARTSTTEQDTALQTDALKRIGVTRIFEEQASGGRWDRPELHRLIDHLRPGDVVVVWKLDRLSRSLSDLLLLLKRIEEKGAGFRSLTENIDTTTPAGRMMMQMVGAFGEYERAILNERTKTGVQAAQDRGVKFGRPQKLTQAQRKDIVRRVTSEEITAAAAARLYGIDPATVGRMVKAARTPMN